jgi:hypothetical protein
MSARHESSVGAAAPTVSAVLQIYISESYLAEALDSILRQPFDDFECAECLQAVAHDH